MAEFCLQCNKEFNNINASDFAGETTWFDWLRGRGAAVVWCEGCGVIQVDRKGACISRDCGRHGSCNRKEERQWKM